MNTSDKSLLVMLALHRLAWLLIALGILAAVNAAVSLPTWLNVLALLIILRRYPRLDKA
jgi:hypothetical protein